MLSVKDHSWDFLYDIPFFRALTEEDFKKCYESAHFKTYSKHMPICFQDDKADRFFIVHTGWVKLYRNTEWGEEAIVSLLTRGDIFGKAAIFFKTDYPFSAVAANESRLIEIPGAVLREVTRNNPDILNEIMEEMSRQVRRLQLEKEHMALMDASQRVSCLLVQLSASMKGDGGTFPFPYEKSLAAARLGMKAESFSRALRGLNKQGVHTKGSEVMIENFSRLAEHCCAHCSATPADCAGALRKPDVFQHSFQFS
ncbi:MAG: Crp/Fnr family transcriptional regulator [Pseudomonadota bacterium]